MFATAAPSTHQCRDWRFTATPERPNWRMRRIREGHKINARSAPCNITARRGRQSIRAVSRPIMRKQPGDPRGSAGGVLAPVDQDDGVWRALRAGEDIRRLRPRGRRRYRAFAAALVANGDVCPAVRQRGGNEQKSENKLMHNGIWPYERLVPQRISWKGQNNGAVGTQIMASVSNQEREIAAPEEVLSGARADDNSVVSEAASMSRRI